MKDIVIKTLRQHEVFNNQKSLGIVSFTLILHVLLTVGSILCYIVNPWLSVLFWLPMGIILCRFFVLEHDAGHYSLFTSKSHNRIAGTIFGFFTMIPSRLWNHIHNVHHGLVGNLSKRKLNPELWTLTVEEFKKASAGKKIGYRVMRSKFMRLFVTPALWIIAPRIPLPHLGVKIFTSVVVHDIIYGFIFYYLAVNDLLWGFVIVYLVPLYLFNFLASVFFYLQHQYEDTLWEEEGEWDLYSASIHGSSHLVVGKVMGWISGNVGCHHVHHLNTRIPSYALQGATEEVNQHLTIQPIFLKELFKHLECVLWDEEARKLISFKTYNQKLKQ